LSLIVVGLLCSVAELIHFCAAPAPACQKFRLRLRLQLVKNFGSGSEYFPHMFSKNLKIFMVYQKFHVF
jgi:hypothetical protein